MLQSFRDNFKGKLATFVIVLMIIPFALFGIDSFFAGPPTGLAAEVNGSKIHEVDVLRAVRQQRDRLIEQMGDNLPPEYLDEAVLRGPVLNELIDRELYLQSAEGGDMLVTDAMIDKVIISTAAFQVDGVYQPERFRQLLAANGFTPTSYRELIRRDMLIANYQQGVLNSGFVTPVGIERLLSLTAQRRTFGMLILEPSRVQGEARSISDEEIENYYAANTQRFKSEELVNLEYITLSLNSMIDESQISDADVKAQYDANVAAFAKENNTTRHAAHILISNDNPDAPDAIKSVESALAEGQAFAAIAKEWSDDMGSRSLGGDLGITDGTVFPPAFEAVLATLAIGEVSKAVETDDGIHFIKLLDIQNQEPPTFSETQAAIRHDLAVAQAKDLYLEKLHELGEVGYNSNDLAYVGEQLGLTVMQTGLVSGAGLRAIFDDPKIVANAFSSDFIQTQLSSDITEMGEDDNVIYRVKEHKPSEVLPLAEVSYQIKSELEIAKVQTVLAKEAEQLQAELANGDLEAVATKANAIWNVGNNVGRSMPDYDVDLLTKVFSMPHPDSKPIIDRVNLADGRLVILSLREVTPGQWPENMPEEDRRAAVQRLSREHGTFELESLQETLRTQAVIRLF